MTSLLSIVASYFDISVSSLLSRKKGKYITAARNILIYILREKYLLTYKKIGEMFLRDHSTALDSVRWVALKIDPLLKSFDRSVYNDVVTLKRLSGS